MKFLGIIENESSRDIINKCAEAIGFSNPDVVVGGPRAAAEFLTSHKSSPNYILIDIGARGQDVIFEIDELAEHCDESTRVVVFGDMNDLTIYRMLLQRGVIEYFVKPVQPRDIKDAFFKVSRPAAGAAGEKGKVISIMSAASGDGSTTVSLNVGYQLAKELKHKTVIVDMDYQFGMLARNLDLSANYGLKELYEHPEGAIDAMLVDKTVVPYHDNLFIISAPKQLKYLPSISNSIIANLLHILRQKFEYVILDLPHVWSEWVSTVIKESDHHMLVSQLWLKSATHASRLLDAKQMLGIPANKVSLVINRSGSKFKEAITSADFAIACKKKVNFYISNDSKTIINSENQGKTAIEVGNSVLNRQFLEIANFLKTVQTFKDSE